jgi:hypothetical protein
LKNKRKKKGTEKFNNFEQNEKLFISVISFPIFLSSVFEPRKIITRKKKRKKTMIYIFIFILLFKKKKIDYYLF